jgi:hypothetical protein
MPRPRSVGGSDLVAALTSVCSSASSLSCSSSPSRCSRIACLRASPSDCGLTRCSQLVALSLLAIALPAALASPSWQAPSAMFSRPQASPLPPHFPSGVMPAQASPSPRPMAADVRLAVLGGAAGRQARCALHRCLRLRARLAVPSLRPPNAWRRWRPRSSSGARGAVSRAARGAGCRRPRHCARSDAASNGSRGLCTGRMRRRDCQVQW